MATGHLGPKFLSEGKANYICWKIGLLGTLEAISLLSVSGNQGVICCKLGEGGGVVNQKVTKRDLGWGSALFGNQKVMILKGWSFGSFPKKKGKVQNPYFWDIGTIWFSSSACMFLLTKPDGLAVLRRINLGSKILIPPYLWDKNFFSKQNCLKEGIVHYIITK